MSAIRSSRRKPALLTNVPPAMRIQARTSSYSSSMDGQINPPENPKSIRINCGRESRDTNRARRGWRGAGQDANAPAPEFEIRQFPQKYALNGGPIHGISAAGISFRVSTVNRAGDRSADFRSRVKPKKPIKHRLFLDKPIDEMAYTNRDWLAVKKRLMT
jgi:hypothetical protein